MGIEEGTTEFTLTRPLEYRYQGSAEFADTVILREPIMDHANYCLKLKQLITRGLLDVQKIFGDRSSPGDNLAREIKPFHESMDEIEQETQSNRELISIAIQASSTVDISEFVETFGKMACLKARKPIALVDGRQTMTSALWSNLKVDDAFNMAVWWCSFFAMPSLGGEQITLEQQQGSLMERTEA